MGFIPAEELSLDHNSSPSFSLDHSELEQGKKDGLPQKRFTIEGLRLLLSAGPRSHLPLCSEKGCILRTAAVPRFPRNHQPGNNKTHHQHQPSGPVKCYLCTAWEVCAQAVKAAMSRWQMLLLPAKHPSRIANKSRGHQAS